MKIARFLMGHFQDLENERWETDINVEPLKRVKEMNIFDWVIK